MRRKINPNIGIFDEIYNLQKTYGGRKSKCKGIVNPKRRKKNSLNKLLDTLWSKAVKVLAKERCEYCGSTEYLNSHHVIGRRNFGVRWNVNNGVCLCAKCHQFSSRFSAHQTPTLFSDWIQKKRGKEWYSQLIMMSTLIKPDKEETKEELETIIYGKPKSLPF